MESAEAEGNEFDPKGWPYERRTLGTRAGHIGQSMGFSTRQAKPPDATGHRQQLFRHVRIKRYAIDAKFLIAVIAQHNLSLLPLHHEYDMVQIRTGDAVVAGVAAFYPLIDMRPRKRRQHLHFADKFARKGESPRINLVTLCILNGKHTDLKAIQSPWDKSAHMLRQRRRTAYGSESVAQIAIVAPAVLRP